MDFHGYELAYIRSRADSSKDSFVFETFLDTLNIYKMQGKLFATAAI
jgi:hypothetical protein